jgi:putative ABC transport system permease protein
VALSKPAPMAEVTDAVEGLPVISRVEGLNIAQTGISGEGEVPVTRTYPDQGHGRVSVTAVPDDATLFTVPKLLEGRWLKPGETGAVVLNQVARKNTVPGIHAGGTVQLSVGGKPTTWRVVGVAEELGGGAAVYTTPAGLSKALGQPPMVSQLRIALKTHDEPTRQGVAGVVNQDLTGAGIAVKSSASISRAEAISAGHLGPIVIIIMAIAIAMGVVGAIGLASTMSANILDRTREFGIMHAIGARPKAVRRTVVAEGVFLGVLSCLVAALPALGLTAILGAGLGNLFFSAPVPFRISTLAVVIWIVLVTLGSVLATEAAATRASRITVREALAYI